jgi:transcriptional antiterminator Rof (Rho-off)
MPARNPRLNVVLERPLYEALERLARRDGTSLSLKARDLLREALESYEDLVLSEMAEERDATFDRARALAHDQVFRSTAKRNRR